MRADRRLHAALGIAALLLCAAGALLDRKAFFASWLAAWWFWVGLGLGAQGSLWIHRLTGGTWVQPIALPLQRLRAGIPVIAVLVIPLLIWPQALYPWARDWIDSARETAFRAVWLTPLALAFRVALCAALWIAFSPWGRPGKRGRRRSAGFAALGLLVYVYSVSIVAMDLLASLMPRWYSSGFGLLVLIAQLKAAMAYAVLQGARRADQAVRNDLGNFLLTYVMGWAYLAFTQFQIIWAENLPAEIAWYVPRMQSAWSWVGIVLAGVGFGIPMVLLLLRRFKQSAPCLAGLAVLLVAMAWLEVVWWIFPSLGGASLHALWMLPLATFGMGALAWACNNALALESRYAPGASPLAPGGDAALHVPGDDAAMHAAGDDASMPRAAPAGRNGGGHA
jgi:hypothetical protein